MDDVKELVAKLRRAHRMSVSDPTGPGRTTMYSEAADALEAVRAEAWDEGAHWILRNRWVDGDDAPPNPYRSEKRDTLS